jgi:hypothetical protein
VCVFTIHSPMMLNNTPEHELVRTVRIFTPIYSIFSGAAGETGPGRDASDTAARPPPRAARGGRGASHARPSC